MQASSSWDLSLYEITRCHETNLQSQTSHFWTLYLWPILTVIKLQQLVIVLPVQSNVLFVASFSINVSKFHIDDSSLHWWQTFSFGFGYTKSEMWSWQHKSYCIRLILLVMYVACLWHACTTLMVNFKTFNISWNYELILFKLEQPMFFVMGMWFPPTVLLLSSLQYKKKQEKESSLL